MVAHRVVGWLQQWIAVVDQCCRLVSLDRVHHARSPVPRAIAEGPLVYLLYPKITKGLRDTASQKPFVSNPLCGGEDRIRTGV